MKKAIGIIILGLLWCNVSFAECIKGDCYNGQGTYVWANGAKYVGGWKTGAKHGKGISTFANGDKHVGGYKNGIFKGQGTFTHADGTVVVGIWNNNKLVKIISKGKTTPDDTTPTPDDGKIIIIGSGSGFFVTDQGHVVSNDHVIGICKKVIAYEEGKEINLDILATDMVNDIGLVRGKFQKVSYLNIKPGGAELGEDIVAFGYPLSRFTSDSVKLTKGIVSALSGPGNNFSQIQIDAAIQPGSSGGPILNMNGQVIGVAVSGLSKKLLAQEADYIPENVNFAVAAQSLMSFLKGNKISVGTGASRTLSTKELAKIGEPATIQLFCMNTMAEYAKLKEADKHSDVLLDLQ
mgnify:CR=1 FL=1|jgi:hypothetical protein|tara:strand:+ start:21 stop:1070 length:1050 start_codon:yes stop_codon:yes gene_type:complete